MSKTAFVGTARVVISFILLPLLASSCSSPKRSISAPTAAIASSTPTQITSPEPNSNGSMARANVHGTGVFVTQGVRQLTGLKWKFDTTGRISATTPSVQGSTIYFGQD